MVNFLNAVVDILEGSKSTSTSIIEDSSTQISKISDIFRGVSNDPPMRNHMVTLTDTNELFCLFIKYSRFQYTAQLAYFRMLIHATRHRHVLNMV